MKTPTVEILNLHKNLKQAFEAYYQEIGAADKSITDPAYLNEFIGGMASATLAVLLEETEGLWDIEEEDDETPKPYYKEVDPQMLSRIVAEVIAEEEARDEQN